MSKGTRRRDSEEFKADAVHLIEERATASPKWPSAWGLSAVFWLNGDAGTASEVTAVARAA